MHFDNSFLIIGIACDPLKLFNLSVVCSILSGHQAPYRWRHAQLAPVQAFLKKELAAGVYTPLLSKGL